MVAGPPGLTGGPYSTWVSHTHESTVAFWATTSTTVFIDHGVAGILVADVQLPLAKVLDGLGERLPSGSLLCGEFVRNTRRRIAKARPVPRPVRQVCVIHLLLDADRRRSRGRGCRRRGRRRGRGQRRGRHGTHRCSWRGDRGDRDVGDRRDGWRRGVRCGGGHGLARRCRFEHGGDDEAVGRRVARVACRQGEADIGGRCQHRGVRRLHDLGVNDDVPESTGGRRDDDLVVGLQLVEIAER